MNYEARLSSIAETLALVSDSEFDDTSCEFVGQSKLTSSDRLDSYISNFECQQFSVSGSRWSNDAFSDAAGHGNEDLEEISDVFATPVTTGRQSVDEPSLEGYRIYDRSASIVSCSCPVNEGGDTNCSATCCCDGAAQSLSSLRPAPADAGSFAESPSLLEYSQVDCGEDCTDVWRSDMTLGCSNFEASANTSWELGTAASLRLRERIRLAACSHRGRILSIGEKARIRERLDKLQFGGCGGPRESAAEWAGSSQQDLSTRRLTKLMSGVMTLLSEDDLL